MVTWVPVSAKNVNTWLDSQARAAVVPGSALRRVQGVWHGAGARVPGRLAERRRERVARRAGAVVPERQRPVAWPALLHDDRPDDAFEPVDVHPVPGQEEP